MNTRTGLNLFSVACSCVIPVVSVSNVRAQDCQNQIEIDVCKAGCTATSESCRALCNFTSGACWVGCQAAFGTCDLGCEACDVGCDACCALPFCGCGSCRDDCDDCRRDCRNARNSCEDGCRLDCDECIFDCKEDCESICRPFRKIGEYCIPLIDRCASGLVCWPIPFPGEFQPRCFPDESGDLYPDDVCRSFYSPALHELAIDFGGAMNYGTGSAFSAGVSITQELGTVYGADGRYGCYVTDCVGGTSDAEVSAYAALGLYLTYDDFRGQSIAFVKEAGEVIVFVTSQIINTSGDLIGTADAISFEASALPAAVGVYDCATIVDTVGVRRASDGALIPVQNSPPVALCTNVETCADAVSCDAGADINQGSMDADGDAVTPSQNPPPPYGIGERTVTLTVTDPVGESDSCSAHVAVNDCTPPEISCPEPVTVACEGGGGTVLHPGFASAADCTLASVTEPQSMLFPVGTTTVVYTATDEAGHEASCETRVTVVDEVPPMVTDVVARPDALWPPNHQMRPVALHVSGTDDCATELDCQVIDVQSNEEPGSPGGGNPAQPDFEIMEGTTVMLRAERNGNGGGRVYTITVECADGGGNSDRGTTTVIVSHDQGQNENKGNRRSVRGGR